MINSKDIIKNIWRPEPDLALLDSSEKKELHYFLIQNLKLTYF